MGELVYEDELLQLWHGDMETVLPALDVRPDLVVADPPYGVTSLEWDRWPDGWPALVAEYAASMWVFGSFRMFLDRVAEFDRWKLSQDVVWEKHNGSGSSNDRFRGVHELVSYWYRGDWADIHHETPTTPEATARKLRRKTRPPHWGEMTGEVPYASEDGGPRLMRSVIYSPSMHGKAINETEKPPGILEPLISYGCPEGGLVLDPFAGSASTLLAARHLGRRCVGIEKRASQCAAAVRRLNQTSLALGVS